MRKVDFIMSQIRDEIDEKTASFAIFQNSEIQL